MLADYSLLVVSRRLESVTGVEDRDSGIREAVERGEGFETKVET
jgi:hypothetical protein